jgi:hypothetical protein
MSDSKEVVKLLQEFFRDMFAEKCAAENLSVTSEEQDSISELTVPEVLENLKQIFQELVYFKKECLQQDKSELVQRNEKFEAMLQKLEAEVRNHIRVEHQLKLHIENNQSEHEELENMNQKLLQQIKELSEKGKSSVKCAFERKESSEFLDKISKLEEKVVKKDCCIAKLEGEIARLKKIIETSGKENNKRQDCNKSREKKEDIEEIKQKFEEKAGELMRFEQILKEKSSHKPMKERNRSLRKSVAEHETSKIKANELKNSVKSLAKVHGRSTSEQMRPLSGLRKR